jgi:2-hydroxychromene-2-carboxylate isomerase
MATIDYYLVPLSPFGYLAGLELEAIAQRHGATVAYKPVQLMRIFAETPARRLCPSATSRAGATASRISPASPPPRACP